MWLWEDGGRAGVALGLRRIDTERHAHRSRVHARRSCAGQGYATSLVAEQSRWLLGTGRTLCFLYTDLDNSTSNALYRRIGYRMIAESSEVRFDPRDAA